MSTRLEKGIFRRRLQGRKKRKAKKPPIAEYTFDEAGSESQEVNKPDKEAKKLDIGEYISKILINLICILRDEISGINIYCICAAMCNCCESTVSFD